MEPPPSCSAQGWSCPPDGPEQRQQEGGRLLSLGVANEEVDDLLAPAVGWLPIARQVDRTERLRPGAELGAAGNAVPVDLGGRQQIALGAIAVFDELEHDARFADVARARVQLVFGQYAREGQIPAPHQLVTIAFGASEWRAYVETPVLVEHGGLPVRDVLAAREAGVTRIGEIVAVRSAI